MNRKDWTVWRFHVIKRSYNDPQYGTLLWGWNDAGSAGRITFDVWLHKALWTVRWLGG